MSDEKKEVAVVGKVYEAFDKRYQAVPCDTGLCTTVLKQDEGTYCALYLDGRSCSNLPKCSDIIYIDVTDIPY